MNFKFLFYTFSFCTLIACQKEKKTPQKTYPKKDSLQIVLPNFNKLSINYIKSKEIESKKFYTKNINIDDFSGSFLVAKNGQIVFENYQGYTNYDKKEKISSSTPLHLASVSKVLTATLVLKLIDEKKLNLETTLQSLFPHFPHKKISIEMLLNHRSGLPNYAYFCENDSIWKKNKTLKNSDILELLSTKNIKLESTPNTKFSYCNTNYALLALVIEKVTKLNYPKAMKKLIFDPLGMKNTFVFELDKQRNSVSKSYKSTWKEIPYDHLDAIYGDKNIYSTAKDILQFDLATYSNAFLSQKIKDLAYKGYSYERKGVKNYGLGIRLNEWEDGTSLLYHNGWWHGNTSAYVTLKKDTVTLISLSNKYTKKPYQIKRLSALFGNYPFELHSEE
jgi:CubicO group peptidase (beta-lactamase class C family)